jgi:peptidoglycan/LPS O-acetylase OafA/YrhL
MTSSATENPTGIGSIIQRKMVNPAYRADIDGLRALAITTVFINHAHKEALPSGFIGVDIFFVISGFVVTWSLIGHVGDHSGVLGFWRRRILRILPALLVMVVGGLLLLALFFAVAIEQHFAAAVRTGLAALVGLSNIYLLRGSSDYFLLDQSINIFNHTWSLGIEEQFYVLFAAAFFSVQRFGHSRWKSLFLWVVSALSLASLAMFLSKGMKGDLTIYYGLHARFWELGIGALLAVAVSMAPPRVETTDWRAEALSAVALALMTGAAFLPDGLRAEFVVPVTISVAGTALFICVGSFRPTLIGKMFAHPALVAVGLLSYSLYLWHWPVLSLLRISVGLSAPAIVAAAVFAFALAWLSFTFVELPAQRYKGRLFGRVLPIAGAAVAATLLLGVAVTRTQGIAYAASPFDRDEWLPPISRPYAPSGALTGTRCLLHDGATLPVRFPDECRLKPRAPAAKIPGVLLVGDSHAFATFAMIGGLEQRGIRGAAFVHDGCPIYRDDERVSASCKRYWELLPSYVEEEARPGDLVLFSGNLPTTRHIDTALVQARLIMLGHAAEQSGARLAIELPHLRARRPAVFCRHEWFRLDYTGCEEPKAVIEAQRAPLLRTLDQVGAALKQPPLYWDPLQHLCRAEICSATNGSDPVLRDMNHMSARAASSLSEPFAEFLARSRR